MANNSSDTTGINDNGKHQEQHNDELNDNDKLALELSASGTEKTFSTESGATGIQEYEESIISEVLRAELQEVQPIISKHLNSLSEIHRGSEVEQFLHSFWDFSEGMRILISTNNPIEAQPLFESASSGFSDLGFVTLEQLCHAMATYLEAAIEIQRRNFTSGTALMDRAETYLKEAGRFGDKFRPFLDSIRPDAFFIGGLNALLEGDHASAEALVRKAAEAARFVARTHHQEGDEAHTFFMGIGDFHGAFLDFVRIGRKGTTLDLEALPDLDALTANARAASDRISPLRGSSAQAAVLADLSDCITEYLIAEHAVLSHLHDCLSATFKPDPASFTQSRASADRARTKAAQVGELGVPIVRQCEQLRLRINNLQRLSKTTKTDYGVYSGIISCVIFVFIFFVGAWVNQSFSLGLSGNEFLATAVALSLIGGFGYGALRFRSFISGAAEKKQDEN